jgi:hypothetical protein
MKVRPPSPPPDRRLRLAILTHFKLSSKSGGEMILISDISSSMVGTRYQAEIPGNPFPEILLHIDDFF